MYFSDIEKLSNMYFLSGKVQSHWVLLVEAPDDLFVSFPRIHLVKRKHILVLKELFQPA